MSHRPPRAAQAASVIPLSSKSGISAPRPARMAAALRLALLGGALALWQPAASAQEPAPTAQAVRSYDIPAGPLDEALTHFARESGVLMAATPEQVKGKSSPGVSGAYSVHRRWTPCWPAPGWRRRATPRGNSC